MATTKPDDRLREYIPNPSTQAPPVHKDAESLRIDFPLMLGGPPRPHRSQSCSVHQALVSIRCPSPASGNGSLKYGDDCPSETIRVLAGQAIELGVVGVEFGAQQGT